MFKKWISSLQLARDIWRRKLGVWLFDRQNSDVKLNSPLKRVVLVRWDAKWGDSIVSSFVFREWRRAFPGICIDVITTPNMSALFKEHFGADHVYEIRKRPGYGELRSLAAHLGEMDLLVHLSKTLKMKDLFFMSRVKAKVIAGLDDDLGLINLKLGYETHGKHFSEKFKRLLERTGAAVEDGSYLVPNSKESQFKVDKFLEEIEKPFLVFNPYGSGQARQLNKDKINDVIRVVSDLSKGINIVVLVTPDKKEEVAAIVKGFDNVFYYPDSQSIYDSIAIMRRAEWVISVDTATVHIANGLGKKLLSIYNPDKENFLEWGPLNGRYSMFSNSSGNDGVNTLDFNEQIDMIEEFLCEK